MAKKSDFLNNAGMPVPGPVRIEALRPSIEQMKRDEALDRALDEIFGTDSELVLLIAEGGSPVRDTTETYLQTVKDEVGHNVVVHFEGRGVRIEVPCEECDEPREWTSPNRIPPSQIAKKLKVAGWRLGRHPKCPKHTRAKPERKQRRTKPMPSAIQPPSAPPAPPPTPQVHQSASDAARAAKRQVLAWLDEAFNVEKGQYRAGITDASIASDVGVAEGVVKNLREDLYGPLKEPTEIEAIRSEIASLKMKLVSVAADNRAAEKGIEDGIGLLEKRIDRLVKANGWKD